MKTLLQPLYRKNRPLCKHFVSLSDNDVYKEQGTVKLNHSIMIKMNYNLMRKLNICLIFFFSVLSLALSAQKATIEGYVFEDGNRGYLNVVEISILDKATKTPVTKAITNRDGVFLAEVPVGKEYIVKASKKVFEDAEVLLSTVGKSGGESVYIKIQMKRKPGYRFEVTMAETRVKDEPVNAIQGATIEVYNNTKEEKVLELKDHQPPTFNLNFEQGNHYTIMVRKKGFFVKRMEAYVNVEGCILCFDGVGEVSPGAGPSNISDVLTEENKQGTLLANVELQKIKMNESIKIENIYYQTNSARLRTAARSELDKLVIVLKDNPTLLIEIGAHTDSNGKDSFNQKLSEKRAKSVVDYLVSKGVNRNSMISKGYGENELVNGCKNGVDCSDRKHALNRRTELKVVGFMSEQIAANKSLFEIKEEEKFEKMLEQIQNEDQIKVADGEDLPDEIKKQLSTKEIDQKIKEQGGNGATTPNNVPDTQQPISIKVDKPIVPESQIPPANPIPEAIPDTRTKIDKMDRSEKPGKTSGSTIYKQQTTSPPVKTQVENNSKIVKERIVNTAADPVMEETTEDFGAGFSEEDEAVFNSTDNNQNRGEMKVNTTATSIRKANQLPNSYSGYKVEFMTSPAELPASHSIFSRHGNIFKEQRKDGSYAYLLGDFKAEGNAYNFLTSIMKERYPTARVIKYENGRRIN